MFCVKAKHTIAFDSVFDRDATQLDVYEETTLMLWTQFFKGNATIVIYGQIGSRKTYTVRSVKKIRLMKLLTVIRVCSSRVA